VRRLRPASRGKLLADSDAGGHAAARRTSAGPTRPAADDVRVRDQPQDGKGDWTRDPRSALDPRRQSDRMKSASCCRICSRQQLARSDRSRFWIPDGRFRGEADMHRAVASTASVADYPQRPPRANFAVTHKTALWLALGNLHETA